MLKYDWERAKVEVNRNVIPILKKTFHLLSKREWEKAKDEIKGNSTPFFEEVQKNEETLK